MKSPRVADRFFAAIACVGPAGAALASGGGMGGCGGLPNSSGVPKGPRYNPKDEAQAGAAALQAGKYEEVATRFEHVTNAAPGIAVGRCVFGCVES